MGVGGGGGGGILSDFEGWAGRREATDDNDHGQDDGGVSERIAEVLV